MPRARHPCLSGPSAELACDRLCCGFVMPQPRPSQPVDQPAAASRYSRAIAGNSHDHRDPPRVRRALAALVLLQHLAAQPPCSAHCSLCSLCSLCTHGCRCKRGRTSRNRHRTGNQPQALSSTSHARGYRRATNDRERQRGQYRRRAEIPAQPGGTQAPHW